MAGFFFWSFYLVQLLRTTDASSEFSFSSRLLAYVHFCLLTNIRAPSASNIRNTLLNQMWLLLFLNILLKQLKLCYFTNLNVYSLRKHFLGKRNSWKSRWKRNGFFLISRLKYFVRGIESLEGKGEHHALVIFYYVYDINKQIWSFCYLMIYVCYKAIRSSITSTSSGSWSI